MSNENSGNVLPSDYCCHLFDFAKLAKIYKFRFANSWFDSPMATWRTLTGTLPLVIFCNFLGRLRHSCPSNLNLIRPRHYAHPFSFTSCPLAVAHVSLRTMPTLRTMFSEMVDCMKKVAAMDVELSVEERNLLSVAYKNVIGARRASWRIISSIEQKEENKGSENKLEMIRQYRQKVGPEFKMWCMYPTVIIIVFWPLCIDVLSWHASWRGCVIECMWLYTCLLLAASLSKQWYTSIDSERGHCFLWQ